MMIKSFVLGFSILLVGLTTATASILEVRDPSLISNTTPSGYDPSGVTVAPFNTIAYGADLWGNGAFEFTFEYMGYEAGYTNLFITGIGTFNNKTTAVGTTLSGTQLTDGWLDFGFEANSTDLWGGTAATVDNGSNNEPGNGRTSPSFFIAYNSADLNTMYLGLNDDGSYYDADFDDLVVKITVSAVPEVSSLYLFGFGLLGLLGLARRRS